MAHPMMGRPCFCTLVEVYYLLHLGEAIAVTKQLVLLMSHANSCLVHILAIGRRIAGDMKFHDVARFLYNVTVNL